MVSEVEVTNRSAVDWALLIGRIVVGVVFLAHGSQKLFGAIGYLVAIGEFFGGLGLVLGFLSRFSAASIIVIMIGAIAMVHGKFGFFMNWMGQQAGEGFEYHLLAIAVLSTILIAGPGRFAIGRFLPLPKRNDQPVLILE